MLSAPIRRHRAVRGLFPVPEAQGQSNLTTEGIMSARQSKRTGSGLLINVAACVLALSAMSAHAQDSAAGGMAVSMADLQAGVAKAGIADLEQVFWRCDYVATTQGLEYTPAELCVAAYEALKQRKFGGDFDGLLAWWQEHKPVAHRAMARFDDPAR